MTAQRTRRYLALALVFSLLLLATPQVSNAPLSALPTVTEVVGSVPYAMVCAACVGRGVLIGTGGWGGILIASMMPGSAYVVAGCIAACHRAILR